MITDTSRAGLDRLMQEAQRLPTTGARALAPFTNQGKVYLAIAQLAVDVPDQPTRMTGGDHAVDTVIFRWQDGRFVEHQRLPVPGGEDVETFTIGTRRFLATASLRSGSGPYSMAVDSVLFEFVDGHFSTFQRFDTFAAKQWKHFSIGERQFLALAQGLTIVAAPPGRSGLSCIFEWDGHAFVHFQDVPSAWGYNWLFMDIGGRPMLAYADHIEPSLLLAWDGQRFNVIQEFGAGGRAFCSFQADGHTWLVFAVLHGDTVLYRWSGDQFVHHQRISGAGGREVKWLEGAEQGGYLVLVNFIHGTREAPLPVLDSLVFRWNGGGFDAVESFETSGGTDVAAFEADGHRYLAVSNSLDANQSFRTDTCIYRFTSPARLLT